MNATPPPAPGTEFVWEAIVDVALPRSLGPGPLGERRIVDIVGGDFAGPRLRGRVLPGGADRQLVVATGFRLLDALYEMETDDGAVLTVHNRVKVIERDGRRIALSHVDVTAPDGPHGWLNESVLVGTASAVLPGRQAVSIRVFRLC